MTLRECIEGLHPDEYIYLSANASAYFCICQVKQVDIAIDIELKRQQKKVELYKKNLKAKVKAIQQNIRLIELEVEEANSIEKMNHLQQSIDELERKQKKVMTELLEMTKRRIAINQVEKVMERPVLEVSKRRMSKPLGTIIVIDFPEIEGKYWFLNEFLRGGALS